MKKHFFQNIIVLAFIFIAFQSTIIAEEVTVGTIRDLRPVVEALKEEFNKQHPEIIITFIFGKEAEIIELLQQTGSVLDVIILDNQQKMNELAEIKFLDKSSLKSLAKEELCVVVKKSTLIRPFMLYPETTVMKGFIISNPAYTASGKYIRESLTELGLWDKASKKILFLDNNNAVASTVSIGHYDGGIMYCSFAKSSFVHITDVLNPKLYSPIVYTSAVKIQTPKKPAAYQFNNFLVSPEGQKVLKKFNLTY